MYSPKFENEGKYWNKLIGIQDKEKYKKGHLGKGRERGNKGEKIWKEIEKDTG